ncbi:MAG: hypothetical protein SOR38_09170 [Oscillospiraceae bacterium]|nr:hypothetical protein [Oscillospiraceae bacterium]MDY3065954.1 hypothetical protein [Oscillospiraceae bacterium]
MDIRQVIDYINKHLGYDVDSRIYAYVDLWTDWWKGYHRPFHTYSEDAGNGQRIERQLYTLRMAKKVCEDWAGILLNEKTSITPDDAGAKRYLLGEDGDGSSGKLAQIGFWSHANGLVEKAFATGTGAFLLHVNHMRVSETSGIISDGKTDFTLDYLTARYIIPLTVIGDVVTEAAFASEILHKGKKYVHLEIHEQEDIGYRITNLYFDSVNDTLSPAELPEDLVRVLHTGCRYPWFAIIRPNTVKTIEYGPGMGQSVFADAIDQLQGVDLAYNNFCRDFKLGGKKVFYDQSLLRYTYDEKAERQIVITPDDIAQQLFMQLGDGADIDSQKLIQEYNPSLRVTENRDGIQAALDYLSFKVGFGTKHYQFNGGSQIVTATQYHGDKQDLIQTASKHSLVIEDALSKILHAVLWVARNLMLYPEINPEADIKISFDDGYIVDPETQKETDRQDVRDGIMTRVEYRVKWYGDSETEALAALGETANPFGFGNS